jgi:hypothetical protein
MACNTATLEYFNPLQKCTVVLVTTEIKWALREYIENKDTRFEGEHTYGKHPDINTRELRPPDPRTPAEGCGGEKQRSEAFFFKSSLIYGYIIIYFIFFRYNYAIYLE